MYVERNIVTDTIVGPAEAVARLLQARAGLQPGARLLIGLAGAPGSGKSTIAVEIAGALGELAVVVPMDGFHLPNAHLDLLGLRGRKGAPETFDAAGFAELLEAIRRRGAVAAPAFDRTLDASIPGAIEIDARAAVVIVEGNYLLFDGDWAAVRRQLDEVWFVEIDERVRRERLIRRHMEYGRTRDEATAWAQDVDEVNARAIASTRARAAAVLLPNSRALVRPTSTGLQGRKSKT